MTEHEAYEMSFYKDPTKLTGIDKKQLEKNLLNRLQDEDEWAGLLETIHAADWRYEPDASYDNGSWSDDSRYYWTGEYLGYRVEITAVPEKWTGGYSRYEEIPPVGEVLRVEVLEGTGTGEPNDCLPV